MEQYSEEKLINKLEPMKPTVAQHAHITNGPASRTRSATKQVVTSVKEYGVKEDQNPRHRRTMEDVSIVVDNFSGVATDAFFAVYDGHGGRKTVKCVLDNLHVVFAEHLTKAPTDVSEALRASFAVMDKMLHEKNVYDGSTAVVCYLRGNEDGKRVLYTANVGDSRAVLMGEHGVVRLSKDHKPSDAEEAAGVVERGGFIGHQGRVNGIIFVSRAFGDFDLKPPLSCEPHISRVELDGSHKMIVLASDGLWDVCTDERAMELVSQVSSSQRMADHLVNHALKNGSIDNISVVTVIL